MGQEGVTGRRVMSAWVKSGADGKFAVLVSTSVGDRELRYYFGGPSSGAPAYVSSTEAHFRSTLALDGCWHRLERNLAADVAAAWSGATLTGVRGMAFHAYYASSAMWVDDVRFSNAMTLERNSLLPGAVGQIACRRATDATNFGHADAFYFYDHIGNVQGVSSAGGSVAESYAQDAWGNVLASATTGQWATSFGGRHLTTKEQDADVGMYYFPQRFYSSKRGLYIQPGSPYHPKGNSPIAKGIEDGLGIPPQFPGDPPIQLPDLPSRGLNYDCPSFSQIIDLYDDPCTKWCYDNMFSPLTYRGGVCFRNWDTGQHCCYYNDGAIIESSPDWASPAYGKNNSGECKNGFLNILEHILRDVL